MSSSPLLDAARALPGPEWLRARHAGALDAFPTSALPTDALEIWRYSRIGQLDLAHYPKVAAPVVDLPASVPAGVRVLPLADHPDGAALLGSIAADATDAFTLLAVATLASGVVIDVPAGVTVADPIHVTTRVAGDGVVVSGRLIVRVGADAEATVVERTSGDGNVLYLPIVELDVADAARLRYVTVQELGTRVWQLGYTATRTGRDATVRTMAVALGGDYARLRTDAALTAPGAFNELLAVYFGEATQMHDFRTVQDHAAPRTRSELLFKGAVEDKAASVYSGLIRIAEGARGSVANQTNRNLILSPDASAESVPNLEILNNDVRCSHASAVGPIDEDHRYYLESRGVPPDVAERLIVQGFFGELLERLPESELHQSLAAAIDEKFARRSVA